MERKNNKHPSDIALSDDCAGNNLLGDTIHRDAERWRAKKDLRSASRGDTRDDFNTRKGDAFML
jgi:hypothetical protein